MYSEKTAIMLLYVLEVAVAASKRVGGTVISISVSNACSKINADF